MAIVFSPFHLLRTAWLWRSPHPLPWMGKSMGLTVTYTTVVTACDTRAGSDRVMQLSLDPAFLELRVHSLESLRPPCSKEAATWGRFIPQPWPPFSPGAGWGHAREQALGGAQGAKFPALECSSQALDIPQPCPNSSPWEPYGCLRSVLLPLTYKFAFSACSLTGTVPLHAHQFIAQVGQVQCLWTEKCLLHRTLWASSSVIAWHPVCRSILKFTTLHFNLFFF